MKRIIVPTDFSKPAEAAANYAAWLAQKLSGKVEIVHVLGIENTENSLKNWKAIEKQLVSAAKQQATSLIESIRNPVEITFTHLHGNNVEDVISDYAVKKDADFVVIGSRGASGLKKALFGSNAANLLNKCSKPVIVVPAETEFNGIHKIAYATDMVHLDEEIKTITRFAKSFDAEITILHITNEDAHQRDMSNLRDILARMSDYKKIDFRIVGNNDVVAGIEEEIGNLKPNLLVMFTHERSFSDKLLGKGLTRQLAFHNNLPLMVINRSMR